MERTNSVSSAIGREKSNRSTTANFDLVKTMLASKVNPHEEQDTRNSTSFVLAVWFGYLKIAEALLEAGADLHHKNDVRTLLALFL